MVLSNTAILRHLQEGSVVIEPFNRLNLATSSYDVTLGPWIYREQRPTSGRAVFNPWSEADVSRVWGQEPEQAEPASTWIERHGPLVGIRPDDQIVWVGPGETILGHTIEFIGGRHGKVTTMMKARSTLGRDFISVCKCAGWGDVGYVNRWTMEISNSSRNYHIPLVVGRRIAQMIFFECELILGDDYATTGKYQTEADITEVMQRWSPSQMLPKMYLDREIR